MHTSPFAGIQSCHGRCIVLALKEEAFPALRAPPGRKHVFENVGGRRKGIDEKHLGLCRRRAAGWPQRVLHLCFEEPNTSRLAQASRADTARHAPARRRVLDLRQAVMPPPLIDAVEALGDSG